jgi:hypothetical protein
MSSKFSIDIDKVTNVYSGKPFSCMCGCSGKYYADTKQFPTMVKKVIWFMEREPDRVRVEDNELDGGKIYTYYKLSTVRKRINSPLPDYPIREYVLYVKD